MLSVTEKVGTARQLAASLLPHLEALANLHYLLDRYITNPRRLKALRLLEDKVFEELVEVVKSAAYSD